MIVFRCDASQIIGSGHVMRCLSLAQELRTRGQACVFLCAQVAGNRLALIRERGFDAIVLPSQEAASGRQDGESCWPQACQEADAKNCLALLAGQQVDWIVVDHYALDACWERAMTSIAAHVLVIDDLANRPHACALLMDQTHGRTQADYAGCLEGGETTLLLGSAYALLREEFIHAREDTLARRDTEPPAGRLNIAMGGVDAGNLTGILLAGLEAQEVRCSVDVILASVSPHLEKVRQWLSEHSISAQLHVDPPEVSALFARADLAIGAAGTTSWERACLGLPTLLVVTAPNQRVVANAFVQAQAAEAFDWLDKPFVEPLVRRAEELIGEPAELRVLSERIRLLCDGRGCSRVAEAMEVFSERHCAG